jgi:hypothetical protein
MDHITTLERELSALEQELEQLELSQLTEIFGV